MRHYHVIPRNGRWHLYEGDATSSLAEGSSKADIIRAARAHVRLRGGRVVVHIEEARSEASAA